MKRDIRGGIAGWYNHFTAVGGAAVLFGVLLALASRPIRRLMSGVH